MRPNKEQQAAIEYLGGPLLVLAGPGTGKTQIISQRVAHILNVTQTNPRNILCLTFTDAAATNMRDRLRTVIGNSADELNIMTYHSFGKTVIDRYQNYATEIERLSEKTISPVESENFFQQLLDELPLTNPLRANKAKDIADLINKLKGANLSIDSLTTIQEANQKDIENLNQALAATTIGKASSGNFESKCKERYFPILTVLGQVSSSHGQNILPNVPYISSELYRQMLDLYQLETTKDKSSIAALKKFTDNHFTLNASGVCYYKQTNDIIKFSTILDFCQKYQTYLADNRLIDYADMILEAIKHLETDPDFRAMMAEQFQYIMLDEFQDSNPAQVRLIQLITDYDKPEIMAVGDDDQTIYEFQGALSSNLVDFYQHYHAKIIILKENYRSTSEILALSRKIADQIPDSFIKSESVLTSLGETSGDFTKNLHAARNSELSKITSDDQVLQPINHPNTHISRHHFSDTISEYQWVAETIHNLIQSGEEQKNIAIIARKHDVLKAILPYLRKYDDINVAYERKENILEDTKIKELHDLLRVIHQLASGQDPLDLLAEIMSSDYLGLNPLDFVQLVHTGYHDHRHFLDFLLGYQKLPAVQNFAKFLAELAKKSLTSSVEDMINFLINLKPIYLDLETQKVNSESPEMPDSNPYSAIIDPFENNSKSTDSSEKSLYISPFLPNLDYENPETLAKQLTSKEVRQMVDFYQNLATLKEEFYNFTKVEHPKLADYIDFLDKYQAANATIQKSAIFSDDQNAVTLISAHKSKGLEFKHVFLLDLSDAHWNQNRGSQGIKPPFNLTFVNGATESEGCNLRLLFVAMTRAAKSLTMTSATTNHNQSATKPLGMMMEINEEKIIKTSPLLEVPEIFQHPSDNSEITELQHLKSTWLDKYLDPKDDLLKYLHAKADNIWLSATDVSNFVDLEYNGPLSFYRNRLIGAPRSIENVVNIEKGNLIHKCFEMITNQKITAEQALEYYLETAKNLDLSEREIEDLITIGKTELLQSIEYFHDILFDEHAKAEVSFSREKLSFEGVPITGTIDHLTIDEQNKTIRIYDFKTSTGMQEKDTWKNNKKLFIYTIQLLFYYYLVTTSPTYKNYTVESMSLLFVLPSYKNVKPGEPGEFFEKTITKSEIADFDINIPKLIHAIRHQLDTLDFLNSDSFACKPVGYTTKKAEIIDFANQLIADYDKIKE